MADSNPTRRRGLLAALLGLTVVSLGAGAFSLAIFTDTAASTGSFASGSIDITSSPSVVFTVTDMMPGDANTQAITIANAGTAQFRYAMTTTATTTLGTALQLEVRELGTNCATFDGTVVLAATALNGAAIGSPTQGPQAGDRMLDGVTNEVLCFRVSLPMARPTRPAGPDLRGQLHVRRRTDRQQPVTHRPRLHPRAASSRRGVAAPGWMEARA